MFEKIEVWRKSKAEDMIFMFLCFKDIETGYFYVQSVDGYYRDDKISKREGLMKNAVELFLDVSPVQRATGYASLKEAIDAAVKDFEIE